MMEMNSVEQIVLTVLTIVGAALTSVIATRLARKSQFESNKINEANGLITRYEALMEDVQSERARKVDEAKYCMRQVSLWRRFANKLQRQLQEAGIIPVEADDELDL